MIANGVPERYAEAMASRLAHFHDFGYGSGYAAGLIDGLTEQAQNTLLMLGHQRFGRTREEVRARIRGVDHFSQLEPLLERLLDASSWDELVALLDQ